MTPDGDKNELCVLKEKEICEENQSEDCETSWQAKCTKTGKQNCKMVPKIRPEYFTRRICKRLSTFRNPRSKPFYNENCYPERRVKFVRKMEKVCQPEEICEKVQRKCCWINAKPKCSTVLEEVCIPKPKKCKKKIKKCIKKKPEEDPIFDIRQDNLE